MSVLVLNVCVPLEDESSVAELVILFTLICEGIKPIHCIETELT